MSQKKSSSKPVWWKNTYFWLAAILFVLALVALPGLGGDSAVRDPGQRIESNLWVLYLVAAVVMFVNGWMSHSQTVQAYHEETQGTQNG